MAQISCRNLTLGYEGRTVVDGLNFEINSGDYLCVLGENGAGKSTLMKTLLGLLRPIGGEIIFGDGLSANEIGYLPQQTQAQKDFPASVWEVVLSGCLNSSGASPFYSAAQKQRAQENMEKLGIAPLKKRSYKTLSGGQQQRVLLARALCATEKVLLDEPAAALDPAATAEMYALIRRLNGEGITVIMISHDVEGALEGAQHVLHIGSPLFFGTKEAYLEKTQRGAGNG